MRGKEEALQVGEHLPIHLLSQPGKTSLDRGQVSLNEQNFANLVYW